MNVECTILVASCDKYADLLRPFIVLFRKYWPDCPFALWLVTETDPKVEGFDRVLACGAGLNWAERERRALKEMATPYVMMLCDDYYLSESVDTALILKRLEQMKRFNAANLRLIPNPKPTKANSKPFGEGLLEYRKNSAYCVATQSGFWELGFLRKLAEGKTSIWDFERYGSFEVGDEPRPLLVTPTKEFPFLDAVHKGCWETWGVQCLKDNGIDYDFSKRGLPPFKTRLVEGLKGLVFRIVPNNWIVRVQNAFNLGAKESQRKRPQG